MKVEHTFFLSICHKKYFPNTALGKTLLVSVQTIEPLQEAIHVTYSLLVYILKQMPNQNYWLEFSRERFSFQK